MKFEHKSLAAGRWGELSLAEQMANIGAEVERAVSWYNKGNENYGKRAFYRALELVYLTIEFCRCKSSLKELTRMRELLVDYFLGENLYSSSAKLWQKYFHPFNYTARLDRS